MAQAAIPTDSTNRSWLDRSISLPWQRLAGLIAHREMVAYVGLIAMSFLLRIWDVGSRAMHHDESLHAYYAWKFFVGQGYTYDPLMHGPLQFEVAPLFYLVFGASEFSARLLAVVLGTALVALPYFLRHHLTRPGALLASLMLAISPSFVYFSRFIRDDMYLACFTLALFICIVRYLETRRAAYMYVGAAVLALAVASMEAAYITVFIFGTFLIFEGIREYLTGRDGPVLTAVRATSLDTWLTAIAIFVVLTVVLYSTFFTNPYGVWDPRYGLLSSERKDILGGLTYWKAQHSVARGGQPWFYYLLVLPLYEQLAVVFGLAGIVYAVIRRSLVTTFLLWWSVASLLMYSWAGEKMPWLSIHISLPLILLAGLAMGKILTASRRWAILTAGIAFALLLALEIHSTFALNYQDGANPTEMLIYVQTSQDVPAVSNEISRISHRVTGGNNLAIGLDSNDVGGWPFIWYLRDFPNVTETTTFSGPVCGTQYCPVLLMLSPEYDQYSAQLNKHYVAQKYRWNWWFPEDYKQWFPDHVGTIPLALSGGGSLAHDPLGTPTDWNHLWNWLVYRQPFGDRGARWMYFLVRRDLVPGSKYYSGPPSSTGTGVAPVSAAGFPKLATTLRHSIGGPASLTGPRGIASGGKGNLYVADPAAHRVNVFSPTGALLRSWGTVGTGPGQFNQLDSPQGVAIGPDGQVFVADTWNQRIEVFSPEGRFLRQWGGGPIGSKPGQFYGPRSLSVGSDGRVYVADTGNKRIQVFSSTGTPITNWGTAGTGAGQFQEPSSVAVGPGGKIYVADFWNQRIQEFNSSGTYVRSWSVTDWTPHSYDEPYLAVDPRSGTVYASDLQQQRVLAWTASGRVLGSFGSGQVSLPAGIAVSPSGVAVADSTGKNVSLFSVSTKAPAVKGKHHR